MNLRDPSLNPTELSLTKTHFSTFITTVIARHNAIPRYAYGEQTTSRHVVRRVVLVTTSYARPQRAGVFQHGYGDCPHPDPLLTPSRPPPDPLLTPS
eukprot:6390938-Pyramimonas_sp.AAC.1